MTHKSKIMLATSPLFCNHTTYSNIHVHIDTIRLISSVHGWFIDVNGQ